VAPLRAADDAIQLDTTAMGFAEQVQFIVDRAGPIFGDR
jgi:cytidylate kinase